MHQDERVSGLGLRMSGRSPRSGCHRRGRSGASSSALDTNRYQRDKGAAALDMSLYMQTVSGSECERGIHVGGCSTVELLADEFLSESAMYNWQERPASTEFHLRLA